MKDLLIKIRMFLEGQAAAAQASNALRQVGDASATAAAKQGTLTGAVSSGYGKLAGYAALLTGGVLAGVTLVTTAFEKFGEALHAAMDNAAESERSNLKLNQALANTNQFTRKASDGIQALATEQQKLTNISDETWTQSAAKLIQFGAAAEDIPQYTKIIEDLAGRLDGDVPRATTAFIGAMLGTRTELTRMGLDVEDGASKIDRLNAIMAIASTGAGQLRAETQDLGGGWKSILVAGGDLLENLGKLINTGGILTGTFKGVAAVINVVNEALGNTPDNTQKLVHNNAAAGKLAGTLGEAKQSADGASESFDGVGESAEGAAAKMGKATSAAKSYADALKEANAASAKTAQEAGESADRKLSAELARIDANKFLDPEQKARASATAKQKNIAAKQSAISQSGKESTDRYNQAFAYANAAEDTKSAAADAVAKAKAEIEKTGASSAVIEKLGKTPDVAIQAQREQIASLQKDSAGPNVGRSGAGAARKYSPELQPAQDQLKEMERVAEPMRALIAAEDKLAAATQAANAAQANKKSAMDEQDAVANKNLAAQEQLATEKLKLDTETEEQINRIKVANIQQALEADEARTRKAIAGIEASGAAEQKIATDKLAAQDEYQARRKAALLEIAALENKSDQERQTIADTFDAERMERHQQLADHEDRTKKPRIAKAEEPVGLPPVREGRIDGRVRRKYDLLGNVVEENGIPVAPPSGTRRLVQGTADTTSQLPGGNPSGEGKGQDVAAAVKEAEAALKAIGESIKGLVGVSNELKAEVASAVSTTSANLASIKSSVANLNQRVDQS